MWTAESCSRIGLSDRKILKLGMNQKLSWGQIKDIFEGEWIELVEFDWGWNKTAPRWARVRHHAESRGELLIKISNSDPSPDSLVMYVAASQPVIQRSPTLVAI